MNCNASWAIIIKIPPNKKHFFEAYFNTKKDLKFLKLGFDLFKVPNHFILKETKINIHNRTTKEQNLIWHTSKIAIN